MHQDKACQNGRTAEMGVANHDVPGRDALREGQPDGEVGRDADLAGGQVGVGRDNGARRKVDALAHHVFPEQPLLLLQLLPDALPSAEEG